MSSRKKIGNIRLVLSSVALFSFCLMPQELYEFNKSAAEGYAYLYSVAVPGKTFSDDGVAFAGNGYFKAIEAAGARKAFLYLIDPAGQKVDAQGIASDFVQDKARENPYAVPDPIVCGDLLFTMFKDARGESQMVFKFISGGFDGKRVEFDIRKDAMFNFLNVSDNLAAVITIYGQPPERSVNIYALSMLLNRPVFTFQDSLPGNELMPAQALYGNGFIYLVLRQASPNKTTVCRVDLAKPEKPKTLAQFDGYLTAHAALLDQGRMALGLEERLLVLDCQSGKTLNEAKIGLAEDGNITLTKNGEIVVTGKDKVVVCDGLLNPKAEIPCTGNPGRITLGSDGRIYFGDSGGFVYAADISGRVVYKERLKTVISDKRISDDAQPVLAAPVITDNYLIVNSKSQINVFKVPAQETGGVWGRTFADSANSGGLRRD